jgi:L-malate glycosyltransferase
MGNSDMTKKPRVLFVGPMLGTHAGWVPSPAEELASHLTKRGYSCLLTSSLLQRYKRALDICLTALRKRKQYDIVSLQVYSGPSFIVEDAVSFLVQRLNKPLVMVLHGGGMPDFLTRFPAWGKRVLRRATILVAPSNYLAAVLETYGFGPRIVPNAIDIALYPYCHRPEVQPRLLWMRTFHPIYNPHMAVDVLEKLIVDFPQAVLTMAGQEKGSLEQVRARVQVKHLEDHVRFAGFLDMAGKQAEFPRHDVFLNTNHVDNMPVSLIEAAAFGMPIVATAVGGVPSLIKNGENGLLVPDNDIDGMADVIRRLAGDPALVRCLSKNARALAETYDWSVVLPSWEALFQEMME